MQLFLTTILDAFLFWPQGRYDNPYSVSPIPLDNAQIYSFQNLIRLIVPVAYKVGDLIAEKKRGGHEQY
jgi:hypothetical protein